ncbi:hypothetical protein QTO34_014473 [Cnephaeus nilssonii]|uniref:Uncharacterized protein n=1 Tax=Cnephaeus nilssonii TaxID=3371016 RepID=A0AA40I7H3_CNENI|nr:hypothetical protein QTO34_014473 [Eptesicus nilssonii]
MVGVAGAWLVGVALVTENSLLLHIMVTPSAPTAAGTSPTHTGCQHRLPAPSASPNHSGTLSRCERQLPALITPEGFSTSPAPEGRWGSHCRSHLLIALALLAPAAGTSPNRSALSAELGEDATVWKETSHSHNRDLRAELRGTHLLPPRGGHKGQTDVTYDHLQKEATRRKLPKGKKPVYEILTSGLNQIKRKLWSTLFPKEQSLDHKAGSILSYLDARSLSVAELICKERQQVISQGMLWKKLIERRGEPHNLQRIQCPSENSEGVYCSHYDDEKKLSMAYEIIPLRFGIKPAWNV